MSNTISKTSNTESSKPKLVCTASDSGIYTYTISHKGKVIKEFRSTFSPKKIKAEILKRRSAINDNKRLHEVHHDTSFTDEFMRGKGWDGSPTIETHDKTKSSFRL